MKTAANFHNSKSNEASMTKLASMNAAQFVSSQDSGVFLTQTQQQNNAPQQSTDSVNGLTYDKRAFIPYKDERDHLGKLIDAKHQSYMQVPP